jgi:hypothetical protein
LQVLSLALEKVVDPSRLSSCGTVTQKLMLLLQIGYFIPHIVSDSRRGSLNYTPENYLFFGNLKILFSWISYLFALAKAFD